MRNVWVGLCLWVCANICGIHAEEPGADQIAQWVKALSSDDSDARDKAEQSLRTAGSGAIPLLENAVADGDTEVKQRAARCLESLKWLTRPAPTDIAAIFPADAAFSVFTNDLKGGVERIRKNTALGKLYDAPTLQPVKEALAAHVVSKGAGNPGLLLFPTWLEHFGGPAGLTVTLATGEENRFAAPSFLTYLGLNGPDLEKDFRQFNAAFPLTDPSQVKKEEHRGVTFETAAELMTGMVGQGRAGHVLLKGSLDEAKRAVGRLSGDAVPVMSVNDEYFKESRKTLPPNPLATLYLNMSKQESTMSFYTMLEWMGLKHAAGILYTLDEKDGLFSEQLKLSMNGAREGWMKTVAQPQSSSVWLNTPPANALGAVFFRFNHEMIPTLLSMNVPDDALAQVIANWEGLDADAAFWVPKPANEKDALHWTGGLEFKDAASAVRGWEDLQRTIIRRLGKEHTPTVQEVEGVKYFSSDWVALLPSQLARDTAPQMFCVSGKALLFGSSKEELDFIRQRRARIPDALTSLSKDFQTLLAQLPVTERGALVYANTPELANFLAPKIWTEMQTSNELQADAVYKILIDTWPDPAKELSTIPGTLLSVIDKPDGVYLKTAGGIPLVLGVPVTAVLRNLWQREKWMREEKSRQNLQQQLEKAGGN